MAARLEATLRREHAPEIVLALGFLVVGILLFKKVNASTFYYDEWTTIVTRRGISFDSFLLPHNDHLSLLPILIYKTWLVLFGLDGRWAFALLAVAGNLGCGLLLYRLLVPRTGPWPAVGATLVLVTLGPAWEDLLWPWQISIFVGLAAALASLIALERDDTLGDMAASVLLIVSISSASIGLVGFLAAGAYIVARRRHVLLRLARVLAAPVVLYGAWYLAYRDHINQFDVVGGQSVFSLDRLLSVPDFVTKLLSAAAAAAAGLNPEFGPAVLIGFAVWAAISYIRIPQVTPLAWAAITLAIAYPVLTAVGRFGQNPESSRYLYPAALFLFLVGAFALTSAPRGRVLVVGAACVAFVVWANVDELRRQDQITIVGQRLESNLTALELARDRVAPEFVTDPTWAPQLTAAAYFSLIDKYGSPAATVDELERSSQQRRQDADSTLLRALAVAPAPVRVPRAGSGLAPPAGVRVAEGQATLRPSAPCVRIRPAGPASVDLQLPAAGLVLVPGRAPVDVRLRRFGDFANPVFSLPPAGTALVRVPSDRSNRPWHARISSGAKFAVCSSPSAG